MLKRRTRPIRNKDAAITAEPVGRAGPYPTLARPSMYPRSLTTMWRPLSSTAPASLSLEKARVTATRLQPIIVPSCSWV